MSGFEPLPEGAEPTAADIANAVQSAHEADAKISSVCFAGFGEPLLRLRELESAAKLIAAQDREVSLRVNTNGLVLTGDAASVATRLHAAGIRAATVALASSDATQYTALMRPDAIRYSPGFSLSLGLEEVKGFVGACLQAGLAVECTTVAAPEVDVDAAKSLATSLGASFRTRDWFA